jgi:hypothetical protein
MERGTRELLTAGKLIEPRAIVGAHRNTHRVGFVSGAEGHSVPGLNATVFAQYEPAGLELHVAW